MDDAQKKRVEEIREAMAADPIAWTDEHHFLMRMLDASQEREKELRVLLESGQEIMFEGLRHRAIPQGDVDEALAAHGSEEVGDGEA